MDTRTLKILPMRYDGTYFEMSKEESDKMYDSFNEDIRSSFSGWYLDGELEALVGYDQGLITNIEEFPEFIDVSIKPFIKTKINGIFNVEVYGIDESCIGYFWTTIEGQRGLVELVSDEEGVKYATSRYTRKSNNL
jgi:hypothetical protein